MSAPAFHPSAARYLTDNTEQAALAALLLQLQQCDADQTWGAYCALEKMLDGRDIGVRRLFRAALGLCDRYYLLAWLCGRHKIMRNRARYSREWLFRRCREVEANPDGFIDIWAREHWKSSLITFAGSLQEILRDPEITIGIFSHTRPVAKAFLIQLKREMEINDEMRACYPDVLWDRPDLQAPKWSENEGLIVKRAGNPKEATIEAWGLVDGMPTGRHYKLRAYDDVVTRETVTTQEQIAKCNEAFELSDNLGSEGGRCWIIGTRYHMADPYKTMIDRKVALLRKHPATKGGKYDGEPVFLTQAELDRKRRTQPLTFAAQQLCDPLAGPDKVFDLAKFKTWEVRPRTCNIFIMVDPAKGPGHKDVGRERDRTAIPVIAMDAQRNFRLVDGYRHRMNLGERWECLKQLHRKWSQMPGVLDVRVGYEQYGALSDDEFIQRMMQLENYFFPLEIVPKKKDHAKDIPKGQSQSAHSKEDRVARLVPDLIAGRWLLPAATWHETEGISTWKMGDDGLVFTKQEGPTNLQRDMIARGLPDLCCTAIRRLDENKQMYDLTRAFLEEAMFFPYGLHDDLLDAGSRVYDLEPLPPQIMARGDLEPTEYVDGS